MPEPTVPEDLTGSADVPARSSMVNGSHVVLIDIRVPSGATFELDSFANFADDVLAFGNPGVMWTILTDGTPHPKFYRVRDQLGLQINPRVLPAGLVKAKSRFQVIAENDKTAAADHFTAGASIQGGYRSNAR